MNHRVQCVEHCHQHRLHAPIRSSPEANRFVYGSGMVRLRPSRVCQSSVDFHAAQSGVPAVFRELLIEAVEVLDVVRAPIGVSAQ